MTTRRANAPGPTARSFWWQGVLILLPVLALAMAGLWALRQDRLIAEQELVKRAQSLADEAAQRVMAGFFPQDNGQPRLSDLTYQPPRATNVIVWVLNKHDRTPRPSLVNLVPQPEPLDFSALANQQLELWRTLDDSAEYAKAMAAAQEFIKTQPPRRFAALAEYRCGTMALAQGNTNAAIAAWEKSLALSSNLMTEAGMPIMQLAQLRLLELWPREKIEEVRAQAEAEDRARRTPPGRWTWMHPWLVQAIEVNPSLATPWLTEAADRRALPQMAAQLIPCGKEFISTNRPHLDLWQNRLRTVELGEAARLQLAETAGTELPRFFWFFEKEVWLAARLDLWAGSTNEYSLCFCLSQPAVENLVQGALSGMKGVPSYLSINVKLAGKTVSAAPAGTRLAAATPLPLAPELQVHVSLADGRAFYAELRRRTLWFGTLLGVAALAAFIGLFAAWRAFVRQQRLAEMKSNFVSSVSHELRAPIASVRLMAEGLESGKIAEPSKQQEYFRFISQECRRLSALIENVLDFARIEQGRKQYEFEPTDAVALVKATVQLLEPVAREKGITLQIEMDEAGLATVQPQWDGRAMQQALINLLDNAIKYSPKGSRVTIALGQNDAALQLSVADEGLGIPTAEHQRIFERFYRVGSEMRREAQGVGIGLSIVKHIVEAHGGRVALQSEPGRGSCFAMELPVRREGMKGAP